MTSSSAIASIACTLDLVLLIADFLGPYDRVGKQWASYYKTIVGEAALTYGNVNFVREVKIQSKIFTKNISVIKNYSDGLEI